MSSAGNIFRKLKSHTITDSSYTWIELENDYLLLELEGAGIVLFETCNNNQDQFTPLTTISVTSSTTLVLRVGNRIRATVNGTVTIHPKLSASPVPWGTVTSRTDVRVTDDDPTDVLAVVYDDVNRPLSVTYSLANGDEQTITLSYTADGHLEHEGIQYRDYIYDVFSAVIQPKETVATEQYQLQEQAREDVMLAGFESIILELKKMNVYLGVITDTHL